MCHRYSQRFKIFHNNKQYDPMSKPEGVIHSTKSENLLAIRNHLYSKQHQGLVSKLQSMTIGKKKFIIVKLPIFETFCNAQEILMHHKMSSYFTIYHYWIYQLSAGQIIDDDYDFQSEQYENGVYSVTIVSTN